MDPRVSERAMQAPWVKTGLTWFDNIRIEPVAEPAKP
jgi:hypothetical protein